MMIDLSQALIERTELSGRIAAGLERGNVLLLADAGFGKTTALEAALAAGDAGAAAWVRARDADRDPGRLAAKLADQIRALLPGIGEEHADRLTQALEPVDARTVAQDLIAELERLLVEPVAVVIDDAERLEGAPSLALVDDLLAAGGPIRVAVCSRRSLALRLAKLRASGRLLELGTGDLAFTPAECAACLRGVRGSEPTSEEVEQLFAATEGWPLGVSLAAAAASETGELAPASREAIFGYLAEEVLDGLQPELRWQVVAASVVDELDPELERALGLPPRLRADLGDAGLSVRHHEGDAYSLHPLMRDFLRARLADELGPTAVAELHARAAGELAGRGQAPDAIEHWLEAGMYDLAASAIATFGAGLSGSAPTTVSGWLERLPDGVRDTPMLRLLAGRVAMGSGDFDLAVDECRAALQALEAENAHESLRWAARFALTEAHLARIDLEAAAEASAGASAAAPEAGPAAIFCALAHAAATAGLGRHEESEATLAQALGREDGRELLGPGLSAFHAYYRDLPADRLDEALEGVDAGIAELRAADMFTRLPYVLAFKIAIQEARGELEGAIETFDALQEAVGRSGLSGYVGAGARLAAATMLALLGRPEEARVQLGRVDDRWASWVACDRHLARAVLAARDGDSPTTLEAGRRALDEAARLPPFHRVRVTSVLTPVLCDAGAPELARVALEGLIDAIHPGDSAARARAALACVLHRQGERAAAHETLAAALDEGGEGARFILRTEWPQVEPVLWSALEDGSIDPARAIEALAAAFPSGPEVGAFIKHPRPEVRDAALLATAAAGRPEALGRLAAADDATGPVAVARERLLRHPPPLAIRALGRFEVRRGSWLVDPGAWERKVAERVTRFLLVRSGEFVPEDELLEAFWPEAEPGSARRGLQTAISSARKVLDLPWEDSRIVADERGYSLLRGEADTVDAVAFVAAAQRALATDGPERIVRLDAAREAWAGEPLPEERYSDWAASWRERLSSLYADVLGALTEAHRAGGDQAAAVRTARALVDLDPLDEHAQRLLMGAYAAAGRRGDALRQFLACRRALVEELGIEPAAETLALHRRVLAG
jgi:ATP/maltotriose-dependent transcriptional regulator MalT/DNA-binding SARP family transcriptional activator